MNESTLKTITEKFILLNQFLIEKGIVPAQLINSIEESNKAVEKAYAERDIRVLKETDREVNAQIRELPIKWALEIKILFKERLNIDLEVVDKLRIKAIQKVLKKGKITTIDQFYLFKDRVDEIYADPGKEDEIRQLDALLVAYEMDIKTQLNSGNENQN